MGGQGQFIFGTIPLDPREKARILNTVGRYIVLESSDSTQDRSSQSDKDPEL
jgi:hypothetical protein